MSRTTTERLKRIQEYLGVQADGILGGETLTALEKKFRLNASSSVLAQDFAQPEQPLQILPSKLSFTRDGIQKIIDFEIGSRAYYDSKLQHPTWPGGDSGVTIGIGYDLGYHSEDVFKKDWKCYLSRRDLRKLSRAIGKKKTTAKRYISRVAGIKIPYAAAYEVFTKTSIPVYAKKTQRTFPGIELLTPNTQTALLSIVYNRGTSVRGERRSEMLAIQSLVKTQDYEGIAIQIEKMKRLWRNRGLDGLIRRRDVEAAMVRGDAGIYPENELVLV